MRRFFKSRQPDLLDSTINWRVHELVKSDVLHRTGRGLFELGSGKEYVPDLLPKVVKISKYIRKNFPSVSFCIWSSGLVNEFAQHLSAYPFILADIERDVAESVFYGLKGEFSGVFLRPAEAIITDILPDFQLPIVVRNLVTESPLNIVNGYPSVSIEKILVDVFCDMEFSFLAGSERRAVFSNAYYKYTVNESKLLRYAARKGRRADLDEYLRSGGFNR